MYQKSFVVRVPPGKKPQRSPDILAGFGEWTHQYREWMQREGSGDGERGGNDGREKGQGAIPALRFSHFQLCLEIILGLRLSDTRIK